MVTEFPAGMELAFSVVPELMMVWAGKDLKENKTSRKQNN
jgi:hypothetical protein